MADNVRGGTPGSAGAAGNVAGEIAAGRVAGIPRPVEMRETHASMVFLTETDVYKIKKPVDLGFLNYSTLHRRALMCRAEVDLNRRLAPGVYLGVGRITREADGGLRLDGMGQPVEYVVHMRRLPDSAALGALLASGEAEAAELQRIGTVIGRFHTEARPGPASYGPATLFRNAHDNISALGENSSAVVKRLVAESRDYLARMESRLKPVLQSRVSEGRIRDGHGDLRAEHVYVLPEVTIIDCIEFARRFRTSDTGLDFAFLAMDVAAQGYPDMVKPLVRAYEAAARDDVSRVLPFFTWYRAMVRAKVADILEHDSGASEAARMAASLAARQHLFHAVRFARGDARPHLIAVGGYSGSGKSTLARALAKVLGARVIGADETRKRLAGLGPGVHPESAIDSGIYAEEMNRRVYASMDESAGDALRRGRNVILDATFRRPADREMASAVAAHYGAVFTFVECVAPDEVIRERLRGRVTNPDPWSDATEAVYAAQRAELAAAGARISSEQTVDTTLLIAAQTEAVLSRLL